MTSTRYDFVVIGSTPLARLISGLLASTHGRRVVFWGESQAGYRLPRGLDLSVAPITRPETWALLKRGVPETIKVISRFGGRRAWSRLDPIFIAQSLAAREALAHVRHMSIAFGYPGERVPEKTIGAGRDGLIVRDAILLHRPTLERALDTWLTQVGVHRVGEADILAMRPDGGATLSVGAEQFEIGQTILADDTAILSHVPESRWPELLTTRVHSTISTEPTRPLPSPVVQMLDRGLTAAQQPGNGLVTLGPGTVDNLASALGQWLGPERAFRQAGQSSYRSLITRDGAPAVGRLAGSGPDVLAGLGMSGAFLAPSIARWLCGVGDAEENAWFGARLVDRQAAGSTVAELGLPA